MLARLSVSECFPNHTTAVRCALPQLNARYPNSVMDAVFLCNPNATNSTQPTVRTDPLGVQVFFTFVVDFYAFPTDPAHAKDPNCKPMAASTQTYRCYVFTVTWALRADVEVRSRLRRGSGPPRSPRCGSRSSARPATIRPS